MLPMMAVESAATGLPLTSSCHGLSGGKIWRCSSTRSASGVSNSTGAVGTAGSAARMAPVARTTMTRKTSAANVARITGTSGLGGVVEGSGDHHFDVASAQALDECGIRPVVGDDAVHVLEAGDDGEAPSQELAGVGNHGHLVGHANHQRIQLRLEHVGRGQP